MATGKAACTKERPTSAGLKTLKPMPPNRALPKAIAANAATAPIHSGNPGGSDRVSSSPVMTAEKSDIVLERPAAQLNRRSVARQPAVTTSRDAAAEMPY